MRVYFIFNVQFTLVNKFVSLIITIAIVMCSIDFFTSEENANRC